MNSSMDSSRVQGTLKRFFLIFFQNSSSNFSVSSFVEFSLKHPSRSIRKICSTNFLSNSSKNQLEDFFDNSSRATSNQFQKDFSKKSYSNSFRDSSGNFSRILQQISLGMSPEIHQRVLQKFLHELHEFLEGSFRDTTNIKICHFVCFK